MTKSSIKISIVIVNYNVRDFLEQALESVKRALHNISSEIFVVDNNSVDGSVQMLQDRFKDVKIIESRKNLGFSRANNLALKKVCGEFVVLLNPDTVVQEDTFTKLLLFFDQNPDASAATCKILNPDGSFSIDCRHSVPTPSIAFWKLIGLSKIFPKSKIFGKYNLTYLDENTTYPVEAISGSFMMIRKHTIDKIGLLDDNFFMYCEDIDYCHRINQAGGKIYYVPETQIVHYKGESSKANNLDYVITFNKSLYQFYKKHYQKKYVTPFKWLILLGVIIRGVIIYFKNFLNKYYSVFIDLAVINGSLLLSFFIRFELKDGFYFEDFFNQYIVINLISSLAYVFSSLFFEFVKKERFATEKIFKVLISTFTFVSALTFFFKQFAFSRIVVLAAAILSSIFMIGWRAIAGKYLVRYSKVLERDFFNKRTVIVGDDEEAPGILKKIHKNLHSGINLLGIVSPNRSSIGKRINNFQIVTSLDQIEEFVKIKKVDLIIFSSHGVTYESILNTMNKLQDNQVEFKIVPEHLEYMIGKSNVEPLDTVPLIDIEYGYGKLFNRFTKRIFDISLSLLFVLALSPVLLTTVLFLRKKIESKKVKISTNITSLFWSKSGLICFALKMVNILIGRMSFVGAPVDFKNYNQIYEYKPGLTGYVQINKRFANDKEHVQNMVQFYLKNQNLFLDLEILLKALFIKKETKPDQAL